MMLNEQNHNPTITKQPRYEMVQYGTPPPLPPGPVIQQPAQVDWTTPEGITNCPPGLQYLTVIDTLLIHQKIELVEITLGCETNNRYIIKNVVGQKVYYAKEENDCCTRNCCGPGRPFNMKIFDNFENEVIHLIRPLKCDSCCCPCCLEKIEVYAPPGTLIGTVNQVWSICKPSYVVKDANNDVVLKINGPCYCVCSCCSDIDYFIYSTEDMIVGKITKQWTGCVREELTDADNFSIRFPMDLDVNIKALLMGATFLIDYMHFERSC